MISNSPHPVSVISYGGFVTTRGDKKDNVSRLAVPCKNMEGDQDAESTWNTILFWYTVVAYHLCKRFCCDLYIVEKNTVQVFDQRVLNFVLPLKGFT